MPVMIYRGKGRCGSRNARKKPFLGLTEQPALRKEDAALKYYQISFNIATSRLSTALPLTVILTLDLKYNPHVMYRRVISWNAKLLCIPLPIPTYSHCTCVLRSHNKRGKIKNKHQCQCHFLPIPFRCFKLYLVFFLLVYNVPETKQPKHQRYLSLN